MPCSKQNHGPLSCSGRHSRDTPYRIPLVQQSLREGARNVETPKVLLPFPAKTIRAAPTKHAERKRKQGAARSRCAAERGVPKRFACAMLAIDWTWQRLAGSHVPGLVATDLIPAEPPFFSACARHGILRMKWLLIACGGAFGSLARYWMQGTVYSLTGWGFPLGTVVVNILGCLLIGLLYAMFSGPYPVRDESALVLSWECWGASPRSRPSDWKPFSSGQEGKISLAILNVVLSCTLGLAAVWCGYRVAEYYFGPVGAAPVTAQFGRVPDQVCFVPMTCRCGVGNLGGAWQSVPCATLWLRQIYPPRRRIDTIGLVPNAGRIKGRVRDRRGKLSKAGFRRTFGGID